MEKPHCFGGAWTQDKLSRLGKYLSAYMTIFKGNEKAKHFATYYVDAFAGTGHRMPKKEESTEQLFSNEDDKDGLAFQKGSAAVALETEPPFDNYIFADKKADFVKSLRALKAAHPNRNIEIVRDDANRFLRKWCGSLNWSKHRAVVFLDPYGAQVEWDTLVSIAGTMGIDLWILFPLGQAVNRMLTRQEPIPSWARRLDILFGTKNWRDEFYKPSCQLSLFNDKIGVERCADFDCIGQYFVRRLKTVFPAVSDNPLALCNSKNVPIYLLCFAASNPKGSAIGAKIANHILGNA